ncbi:restriction endonuclease subunit S [[Kitasatospora] papulosa]
MSEWETVPAGSVATQRKDVVMLEPGVEYRTMGVRWYNKGAYDRGIGSTETIKAKRLFRAHEGDFVFNRIDTQNGAFDVVPAELHGALATNEFPLYVANPDRLLPRFLLLYFQQRSVLGQIDAMRAGSEGRSRWKEADFEAWRIPLPSLTEQRRIVDAVSALDAQVEALEVEFAHVERVLDAMLTMETYGGAEWPRRAFSDVIDFREGPGIMAVDFRDAGVPLIRLAGLTPGESILAKCNYLDPQKVDKKWSHFRVELGDVLLSTSAALGRVAVVDAEGVGAIPYTGIIRMRPATDLVEPSYIPWLLRSADFASQIADAGVGTTMAHFGPTHLRKMTIPLPPVETQLSIAETLQQVHATQLVIASELTNLRAFRSALLASLLNQEIEIPESYDALLEEVS